MFSPNAGLVSPLTTKGDLWGYDTTNIRVPVGTDNKFLMANSGSTGGVSWENPTAGSVGVTLITSSITLGIQCDQVLVSGGTFNITLPNAASFTVKPVTITRVDQNLLTPIGLIGLIGGSTNWALYTQNESVTIIPRGGAWDLVSRFDETGWTKMIGITITATTSNPVKGNTPTLDNFYWRRVGANLEGRYEFQNSTATGSSTGSGDYVFMAVPITGVAIDLAQVTPYVTAIGTGSNSALSFIGGGGAYDASPTSAYGLAFVHSTLGIRFYIGNSSNNGAIGSGYYPLNVATRVYNGQFSVPILGWK